MEFEAMETFERLLPFSTITFAWFSTMSHWINKPGGRKVITNHKSDGFMGLLTSGWIHQHLLMSSLVVTRQREANSGGSGDLGIESPTLGQRSGLMIAVVTWFLHATQDMLTIRYNIFLHAAIYWNQVYNQLVSIWLTSAGCRPRSPFQVRDMVSSLRLDVDARRRKVDEILATVRGLA